MNESTVTNRTWQWYKEMVSSWLEHPGTEEFQGLNLTNLKMDQAYLTGISEQNVGVYRVSDDCFRVSTVFIIVTNHRFIWYDQDFETQTWQTVPDGKIFLLISRESSDIGFVHNRLNTFSISTENLIKTLSRKVYSI